MPKKMIVGQVAMGWPELAGMVSSLFTNAQVAMLKLVFLFRVEVVVELCRRGCSFFDGHCSHGMSRAVQCSW